MQKHNLNCKVRVKKSKRPGNPYYKTHNLLNRNFKAEKPLEVLLTDITYLPFRNTMLYLSWMLTMVKLWHIKLAKTKIKH